jgi:4-aminobutyrate aminotransferase/(S)-3-amino-2-methylpropionate transaminase
MDPNPEALTAILKYCTSKGVLILSAGTYGNVIRLLPPLIIEEDLLRDGLSVLDEALASIK